MKWLDPVFRYFENRVDPFATRETYEPPSGFFAYLWFYVSQLKWVFVAVFVFGLLNALIEATIFSFVGDLVDMLGGFEGQRELGWAGFWSKHGTDLLWMLFIVAVARVLIVAIGALLEEQVVVPGFFTMMRWQSHKHVLQQSLSFFQNDLSGRIAQKVFQSGNAGGDLMLAIIQTGGFISAYAATTFAMVAFLDGWLGVTIVVWMVGFVLLARYFIPRIRWHGKNTAEAGSKTTGRLVDGYGNIATVKLHAANNDEEGFIKEALVQQYEALKLFTRDLTGVRVSLSLLSNLMIVLITWQTLSLWFSGGVSTGQVAFVLALVLRLNLLLNRFMGILNGIFRTVGTVQNSMELIARPIGLLDHENAGPLKFKQGEIRFEKVRFRYGMENEVVDGFDLVVRPGERIGLVGHSGVGKTTIVNLLLRFFDVEEGAILIDGQDVRYVTQDSLRSHFGMVAQETALFQRSVKENISLGRPDATMQEIEFAAQQAKAHDFILQLEDGKGRKGYEAHVGERGVKLSGGQRQRIAIARAILQDAPILILDEATSALDSEVEAAIQDSLFDLMNEKTVIAIAHRLSTISSLDRLIVMDKGRIVESGSHDELIARKGHYAKLWQSQSGGFLKTDRG